jgi:sugar phosphate isomerase/epimerase
MLHTRTGAFPIGFRRGWSAWQKDLPGLVAWAKENGLGVVDLGGDGDTAGAAVTEAGLKIGSVDLRAWSGLITADETKREAAIAENNTYIAAAAAVGAKNFFTVLLPDDVVRSRRENLALAIEGLSAIVPALEAVDGHVVIEGWPGPGALACTPEGYRAVLDAIPSKAIGINYDPSHLIRMGIDPIRFLEEFKDRVFHVHGKDTEIFNEAVYEYGTEQEPTLFGGRGFGGPTWRYTIPGHGEMRWTRAFEILAANGYQGAVSIELEDLHFNTDEAGEKAGLLAGAHFLAAA